VTDRTLTIAGIRVIEAPAVRSPAEHSRYAAKELVRLVTTPYALLIQWDAFVVHGQAWSAHFLDCDYLSALRSAAEPADGGITLVSRRLLEALGDARIADISNLDLALRSTYRPLLEREFGIRYPATALSEQFAFGEQPPIGQPFGFQGLYNMWMFFQRQDLEAFLGMASPAILASADALSLAINLRDLGRIDEARSVLGAILRAHPDHDAARTKLDAIAAVALPAQPARVAVGRNDPCPCGSGQKFKQCHGRLTGAPTALPDVPISVAMPAATTGERRAMDSGSVARGSVAVLFERARVAFERGDMDAAERLYRTILERIPEQPVALGLLGVIATHRRDFDAAQGLLLRAVAIAPDAPEGHNNIGLLEHSRARFSAAAAAYRRALALAPDYAAAHNNLGLSLQEQGEVDAAIESFRAAVQSAPEFADAHWNLALALLLSGQFEQGFAEQEWRLRMPRYRDWWSRRNRFPAWQGETLTGKRLLILAEQGMGDMIQFVRYAELLAASGAIVLVEAAPELGELLRTIRGVAGVVRSDGPYPACDYQVAMLSLPLRCGTRLGAIPAPAAYVVADPQRRARWREMLGARQRPRVGIAWAGNPDHVRDAYRSLPLLSLGPLLAVPGIEWISLQKGAAAAQIGSLPAHLALLDMASAARDFADTAALIAELDLVITVDTSIVHLAGALGAPTLLLIDTANDWRWLQRRPDSPWYPSVELLRQTERGDWAAVIAGAVAAVRLRFAV
ncbi:MAG: tetratricopeptide repeat protein, partial [Betaproteobacteria bacterium]